MIVLRLIFFLLFSLCVAANALALNLSDLHEVQLPIPATLEGRTLGTALSIFGSTAAVAAHSDDKNVAGSVYLYTAQENWRIVTELITQFTDDDFAKRIVLTDNMLIVSASGDDSHGIDSGAVYIFERNLADAPHHWQQTAKLIASDAQTGDRFGSAIAFEKGVLYIGAPKRGQGKVYIFNHNTDSGLWQATDSLEPKDPQALRFGATIAQDRQTLIIGAPYTDADNKKSLAKNLQPRFAISKDDTADPGIESGAIYVYNNSSGQWRFTARLGSSNRETADHLGNDIAIEGNIIAASVTQKDVFDDLRAGTVYVYKNVDNAWQEDMALIASDPNVGANFGGSFTLVDKQVLVGANKIHANGFNSGQAYLFTQDSNNIWELIHQQASANLMPHDQFGLSVALGSKYMLIASKHAVYAFQNTPIQYHPVIFYLDNNTLQLNEVAITGVGVLAVEMHLSHPNDKLILTVTDFHLRTGIENSDTHYSSSTGLLTIPQLAVQASTGDITLYSVVLQQIGNSEKLQFQVLSLSPIQP